MQNHSQKIVALLGPTNTGKTYVAIEKMLQFNSGIFGLPLRLLAREVYDTCVKKVGLDKPLVVRLEGTNVEMGIEILKNSGFPIKPVETMEEAAQKVVEMVKGG